MHSPCRCREEEHEGQGKEQNIKRRKDENKDKEKEKSTVHLMLESITSYAEKGGIKLVVVSQFGNAVPTRVECCWHDWFRQRKAVG
jgi:hypothetical protein